MKGLPGEALFAANVGWTIRTMSGADQNGKRRGLAEAERRIEAARATGAKELDLSRLELAAIPDWLAALTKLEYLGLIQALARDSPVLLVATWADRIQPNIPLAELKEKCPHVVDLYAVDHESGNGVEGVRGALQRMGAALDHVGQPRPASWVKVTEARLGGPVTGLAVAEGKP